MNKKAIGIGLLSLSVSWMACQSDAPKEAPQTESSSDTLAQTEGTVSTSVKELDYYVPAQHPRVANDSLAYLQDLHYQARDAAQSDLHADKLVISSPKSIHVDHWDNYGITRAEFVTLRQAERLVRVDVMYYSNGQLVGGEHIYPTAAGDFFASENFYINETERGRDTLVHDSYYYQPGAGLKGFIDSQGSTFEVRLEANEKDLLARWKKIKAKL